MSLSVQITRNGRGIVAGRSFKRDEDLFEVVGAFITGDEDEDIDDQVRDNAFRFDEDRYISPQGSIGDFQNHSCAPNAKVEKRDDRLFVVAVQPIQSGEEVLIDYSTIIASDDSWEMKCNCGAQVCRGIVSSFDALPKKLQKEYIKNGIVPKFITEL